MASKSKKNNSQATQNTEEVVETPVVETPVTENVVAPEVTQESGEPVSTDVNPEGLAIEPSTEATENVEVTVDTQAPEGTEAPETEAPTETPATEISAPEGTDEVPATDGPVDTSTPDANPTVFTAKTSNSDKYTEDEDQPATPPVEPPTSTESPVTPVVNESSEIVDRELMRKELGTNYDVKFSYSQASRRFAVNRKMTLLAMYDIFVKNRQAFVGLKSQDDYNHIHDFMTKYSMIYNYREIPKAGKEQFLEKLRTATDFVVLGK